MTQLVPLRKRQVPITSEQLQLAQQGLLGRFLAGVRNAIAGITQATWMSPGQPLPPAHQEIIGRQLDYPVGYNYNYAPRSTEPVSFATLRQLADGYDLMRLIIETRKDQLCKMTWKIVAVDEEAKVDDDPRVAELKSLLALPDRVHTWQAWLRMLLEDQLVIDAATIYPRRTLGGGVYALDIVDGATIKVVIDQDGRRPPAPEPAYQQVIKGLPAVDYSADELIYMPRNPRSWKLYGQSPVEQVIMTVNIALRRQLHQLQFYTEGNIPEALAMVPDDWTPDQVEQMQKIWDSLMEGNTGQRRHMKFIPGMKGIVDLKEAALKDEYDEWLARIICYCFSVSPTPFIKQMNRATAESQHEAALQEGLAPQMAWVRDLLNIIIQRVFGYDDLCFAWEDEKDLDPKQQADIHTAYIAAQVMTVDEVRKDLGMDPRTNGTAGDGDESMGAANGGALSQGVAQAAPAATGVAGVGSPTPTGAAPVVQGQAQDVQDTALNGAQVTALLALLDEVASKHLPLESAKAVVRAAFPAVPEALIDAMLDPLMNFEQPAPPPTLVAPLSPDKPGAPPPPKPPVAAAKILRKALRETQTRQLTKRIARALHATGVSVAKQVTERRPEPKATKASRKPHAPHVATLDLSALAALGPVLGDALDGAATGAATAGLAEVDVSTPSLVNLANTRAERWAAKHAGELIGAGADGGELTSATREMIRATLVEAEAEGWSNDRLAEALKTSYAFSPDRAETIARTELKLADSQGAMIGYRTSGVVAAKVWETSNDDVCDECTANEEAGEIPLDDDFPSGDDTTPAHPNCNCVVTPIVADDDTTD